MKKIYQKAGHVLRFSISVLLPVLVVASVVYAAGSLMPPSGTPAATSYTLDDIYTRLTTNAGATAGNHNLSTTTSPSAPAHGLTDIYNAIPTINATKIDSGTTYLGITGTLMANEFNGTCNSTAGDFFLAPCTFRGPIAGGSQADGGVDDFSGVYIGATPPSDRYATLWTACSSGNNYCGTGDAGADEEDSATGLVWSYPCTGSGCSSWDTVTDSGTLTSGCTSGGNCAYFGTDTTYTWDSGGGNNNSLTAGQLCSGHSGWSLPHQKQLLQAYIDGAYGNLEPQGVYRYYWSATIASFGVNNFSEYAWTINLSDGYAFDNKVGNNTHSVRCVRLP
ncbi:MAG TPA: DUF1566 domain-containing protein [Candidatus Paceibacterota bacterium]|nr:DUF1566 domain-containing protein [Candidatus Paceibacterota bacterium]